MRRTRRAGPADVEPTRKIAPPDFRQWLVVGCILLLTLVVYAQVAHFPFAPIDDPDYVADAASRIVPIHQSVNGYVSTGLTMSNVSWALTTFHASNWHPLTWMSHMLDCQLFGLISGWHHVTNLLFHLANVLLLFVVLRRATGLFWRSAFVAGLFALHPLHVESVVWISERKDVLSTFFLMLTLLAYIHFAAKPNLKRYLLVVSAFVLGLMAKPMLVSLPIVLLLLDYWPLKRTALTWKRLIVEKIPLFTLSLISAVLTWIAQQRGGAMRDMISYPLGVRAANAVVAYVGYLAKMVLPINLGTEYPHPGSTIPVLTVLISALVLIGLTAICLLVARARPYAIVGWLFYLITLVPVIGLVQVGGQGAADRYTYVPLIGIFIAIAWTLPELLSSHKMRLGLGAVGAVILVALSVLTTLQVRTWRSEDSFIRQTLVATHNHPLSRCFESRQLVNHGKLLTAEKETEDVVREYPRLPDARLAHAFTLGCLKRYGEAIDELKRVIDLRPDRAEAFSNIGVLRECQGRNNEAVEWCAKAVRMKPGNSQWRANYAQALAVSGRLDDAIAEYERAVSINPDYGVAHRDLGVMLYQNQDVSGAIEHLETAVAINPVDAKSQQLLGALQDRAGFNNEAIAHLSEAVRIRPDWPDVHASLAAALNSAGLTEQARQELAIAKRLSPKGGSQ